MSHIYRTQRDSKGQTANVKCDATEPLFVTMANNKSSSDLEQMDSVQNVHEQSSEPIFKTPSPFWNQDSIFRRPKHFREPRHDSITDAHPTFTLYPYRSDLVSVTNPDLSCVIKANQTHPSLSLNSTSSRYLTPSSKLLLSDPNSVHSIGRGSSYWNYFTSDVSNGLPRGFRNLHNPHWSHIDPFSASYYYRGVVKDALSRDFPSEEIKIGEKERLRYSQWYHKPQKQRILHSSNNDSEKLYLRNNPHLGSLLHKDYLKHNTEYNHHQPLTLNHSTATLPEKSRQKSDERAGEELPLLVWSGDAEKHHTNNTGLQSTSSSPALCVLHRFVEGSLVELEGGRLKRVEDLKMEDLEQCAQLHPELRLRRFTVRKITHSHTPALSCLHVELQHDQSQLSLEVSEGLPFFVCGQGWSSCNPQHTSQNCRLQCHQLKVGDVCLAVTHEASPQAQPANHSPADVHRGHTIPKCETEKTTTLLRNGKSRKRHFTAPELRELSAVDQTKE